MQGSPQLLDALRRLADADGRDLDALVGAADVASKLGEREQALQILSAVLGRATAAWRGTAAIRSARSVDAVAKWAIDGLVDLYRTGGRARAAVDTLIEAARLPFDQDTRRDMRLRAAQLATVELGDNAAAIDMYRGVLAQSAERPRSDRAARAPARRRGSRPRAAHAAPDPARPRDRPRQASSSSASSSRSLVGIVEERGGRLDALQARTSRIAPVTRRRSTRSPSCSSSKGQHRQLADLLEQQAQRLETDGDIARAAKLWARYAHVAENDTKEIERAISRPPPRRRARADAANRCARSRG